MKPVSVGCRHGTARMLLSAVAAGRSCSWYAAPAPAAVDRHLLPARRSAANPLVTAAAVDRRDRQTDARPLHTPCSAYYAAVSVTLGSASPTGRSGFCAEDEELSRSGGNGAGE